MYIKIYKSNLCFQVKWNWISHHVITNRFSHTNIQCDLWSLHRTHDTCWCTRSNSQHPWFHSLSATGAPPNNCDNQKCPLEFPIHLLEAGTFLTEIHWFTRTENNEVKLLVAQLCLTLCDPIDCNLPGSSVHGILQGRIQEWAAIPFSRGSSRPRDWTWVSCICRQILYHVSYRGSPDLSEQETIWVSNNASVPVLWQSFHGLARQVTSAGRKKGQGCMKLGRVPSARGRSRNTCRTISQNLWGETRITVHLWDLGQHSQKSQHIKNYGSGATWVPRFFVGAKYSRSGWRGRIYVNRGAQK